MAGARHRNEVRTASCLDRHAVYVRALEGTAKALTQTKTSRGFRVLPGAVPRDAADAVLRHIHRDIATRGLPQEWLAEWLWNAHWFPHLRWDDEIVALLEHLPPDVRTGELCDPQIVGQMPDEPAEIELEPHVDQLPDWANGRPYLRILGVALTRNGPKNGGLSVWPLDGDEGPHEVDLEPGDVLVMYPRLPHASGLNRTGSIRYCVYFRFLAPAA
jgi:ectoine hydroxylase-related dioxygenase (phytanoyl-CoA dioxygenase family)